MDSFVVAFPKVFAESTKILAKLLEGANGTFERSTINFCSKVRKYFQEYDNS